VAVSSIVIIFQVKIMFQSIREGHLLIILTVFKCRHQDRLQLCKGHVQACWGIWLACGLSVPIKGRCSLLLPWMFMNWRSA